MVSLQRHSPPPVVSLLDKVYPYVTMRHNVEATAERYLYYAGKNIGFECDA